ncbi:MAG: DUF2726 domain-containing protein [Clostridia bacterium]|nr:DUF2726 domain-containing protein [Clostridia bacterium]
MDGISITTLLMILSYVIVIGYLIVYKIKNKPSKTYKLKTYKTNEILEQKKDIDIELKEEIKLPYKKKFLLTKNEWSFYKRLKPVADELGYTVLAKIRVADLVEVTSKDRSEWQTYFNKVNKKHVDFVLAKPENLQIILLIELDDNTHNEAQKKRDEFIEALYKQTGYKLLRTHGIGELKEKIMKALEIEIQTNQAPDIIKI